MCHLFRVVKCVVPFPWRCIKGTGMQITAMRLRATLASILTVILLSISSTALSCEIKCDFASLAPSCHGSRASLRAQHGSMPAMAGMTHDAVPESAGVKTPTVVAQDAPCRIHDCIQQPTSLVERRAAVALSPSIPGPVTPSGSRFVPEPALTELLGPGPPPCRPSTPVTLSTTLRV